MLSCILRSPLQVAFSQAVKHDLSGGLLTCLVVLGQKCTIVCTGAERSSLWRRSLPIAAEIPPLFSADATGLSLWRSFPFTERMSI